MVLAMPGIITVNILMSTLLVFVALFISLYLEDPCPLQI